MARVVQKGHRRAEVWAGAPFTPPRPLRTWPEALHSWEGAKDLAEAQTVGTPIPRERHLPPPTNALSEQLRLRGSRRSADRN